ncbi:uncharacterized protein Z519_02540 [Cladophialophora bantiana CBS 173.52]|uniref:Tyrosine specific protein phosphatases domain-containing protein n=1 Tax=Cladophialophora bantiana (strain ATCC 10958 / CBS 173.52 / CDC B-1940 / NIH 8579) TaxID=1442370 RepID=A0A0D2HUV3_CLAB1|nr:uncharacterized protein Z519_02540 [Cladophialophora bantiana CBS 173.52]KIW97148.1 hypothetical protein Z519_02540 [Cladophialophora bantiana CBS 173.52]
MAETTLANSNSDTTTTTTTTSPAIAIAADPKSAQPEQPYQPYMDVQPPTTAHLSDANGMPLSEKEIEALESEEKAEREATPEPSDFSIAFPDHLPTPPFLHVQGVPNFRELGGYPCQPPSSSQPPPSKTYVLKKNLLYRCAHPTHLTPTGASYLTTTLNVHDMYDLRSAPEINRLAGTVASSGKSVYPLASPVSGCIDEVPGLNRHFVPVYQTEDYGPVALATKLAWYTAEHSHDEEAGYAYSDGFVKAYRDIATHGVGAYRIMFKHLLERPNEPLVFHCTAGKDRTGVFGALVMKLVGVDEDMICWEYALTEPGLGGWRNEFIERIAQTGLGGGGGKPQHQQQVVTGEREHGRPVISREEAARICGSRAGNMRAFLRTVLEGEFGGVNAYLTRMCGFSQDEVARLRENLVEMVDDAPGQVMTMVEIDGWSAEGGCVD